MFKYFHLFFNSQEIQTEQRMKIFSEEECRKCEESETVLYMIPNQIYQRESKCSDHSHH